MNALAERYVKLVLALGQHDVDYVDAYYGPAGVAEGCGSDPRRRWREIDRDARAPWRLGLPPRSLHCRRKKRSGSGMST